MIHFRGLVTRYEPRTRNFLAFTKLARIATLLRRPVFRVLIGWPCVFVESGLRELFSC